MCQFAEAPLFFNPLDDPSQGSRQWILSKLIVRDLLDQQQAKCQWTHTVSERDQSVSKQSMDTNSKWT